MSAVCSICKREDRPTIEQAHVDGLSLRVIASQHPGTTAWSLRRHFQHVPAIIEKQQQLQARQERNDRATAKLPTRVEQLIAQLERLTANALRRKDYASALRAITSRLSCLRTIGELSGELRNVPRFGELVPGTGVTAAVQVNVNAPAGPAEGEAEKHARFMQTIANIYGVPWPREQSDNTKPN
jgi:hypothetical protein